MSGHKRTTITLSQEEYRKLHEAEMRLRFMNEGIPEIINQTRNEINQQLQTDIEDMHFRQTALIETLDQVNSEISNIEQNTSQVLIDQHLALQHGIAEVMGDYHVNTESALASMESQVKTQLGELLDRHNQEWEWITTELQHQSLGQEHKRNQAQEWIDTAFILEQFIIENYDHDRFTPGIVQHYATRLVQAQNNLAHDLPEAAITAAQEAYNNFSELRIELEKHLVEYRLLLSRIHLEAQKLHEIFRSSQVVPAIDLDGQPLPYNITVNYWSDGKLEHLEREFESVMQEMVETTQPVNTDELHQLVDDYFPCVEDKIADLVFIARMKVINAQLRMNIAEIVVSALSGQGYSLDSSFFLSGDERDAYQANLINYEGSQVVVKVDPIQADDAANELNLFTSDAQDKTSHELKQRALEIRRALMSSGLEVGPITASLKNPDPKLFNNLQSNTLQNKLQRKNTKEIKIKNQI
jgi:hypothetical protein